MLLNLHVKNLAIIDEVEVEFSKHLNILTGETGAGKSILIGSINIALGGKVSPDLIRKGADYGFVELVFQVKEKELKEKMKSLDIPMEDGIIILSRKIMKNRTICKINGETVTTTILKSMADSLIDIHGQHEHQSLLYKKKHLEIVDQFSKEAYGTLKEELQKAFQEYKKIEKDLIQVEIPEEERLRELSFLEYEIKEIESANLVDGEDIELETEYRKLSNASEIAQGMGSVYQITKEGSNAISDEISRAGKILNRLEEFDHPIKEFNNQLMDIDNLINDFNRELADYMSTMEYNESELLNVEQRLNLIHNLKAKFGSSISEIKAYYEKAIEKKKKYEEYDQYMDTLKTKLKQLEKVVFDVSERISVIRKISAKELVNRIKSALIDLNFLEVQFDIVFKTLDYYTENGTDEVEFLISTNPGEDMKPLGKVASGGELSRIMLAIKSVLAEKDFIDTLIFDEIDVGISGRTAQKVSEKLAALAMEHQIISITHLPQIASMADSHFIIEKTTDGLETKTNIQVLKEKESVKELARMLSGAKITDAVINNAREMKELAATTKKY